MNKETFAVRKMVVWYRRGAVGPKVTCIVAEVPPGTLPVAPEGYNLVPSVLERNPRKEVSYLVCLGGPKLCWPQTKYLRLLTPEEEADRNFKPSKDDRWFERA